MFISTIFLMWQMETSGDGNQIYGLWFVLSLSFLMHRSSGNIVKGMNTLENVLSKTKRSFAQTNKQLK
jgi:hypothetical protein